MTRRTVVYLPIEIKHRELDARLMMAVHFLNAGVAVVFGQQWAIFENCRTWPAGLLFIKTVNKIQAFNMAQFRNAGHIVAATDEEALTFSKSYCVAFSPDAADNCDVFFAQNEFHKADVEKQFPQLQGKVVISGNPRIEITSRIGREAFRAEANEIRRQTGPFVLFNANYSGINSKWNDPQVVFRLLVHAGLLNSKDPNAAKIFKSWMKWEAENRAKLLVVLNWAANNLRGRKVVIRPHPAERVEFWRDAVNNHPNIIIVPQSHHLPWIMASDLVVHTSCTTGLEAALLDKPALNIQFAPDPMGERITDQVNPTFAEADDAIAAADSFLHHNTGPLAEVRAFHGALEKFFPGFQEGGPAKRIADECLGALTRDKAVDARDSDWSSVAGNYTRVARPDLAIAKFSMSSEEMINALSAMCRKVGVAPKVTVAPLDDSLFLLRPA